MSVDIKFPFFSVADLNLLGILWGDTAKKKKLWKCQRNSQSYINHQKLCPLSTTREREWESSSRCHFVYSAVWWIFAIWPNCVCVEETTLHILSCWQNISYFTNALARSLSLHLSLPWRLCFYGRASSIWWLQAYQVFGILLLCDSLAKIKSHQRHQPISSSFYSRIRSYTSSERDEEAEANNFLHKTPKRLFTHADKNVHSDAIEWNMHEHEMNITCRTTTGEVYRLRAAPYERKRTKWTRTTDCVTV